MNRRWTNPSPYLHPSIFGAKMLTKISDLEHGVALFVDIHGHSRKKNIFMYGCTDSSSQKTNAIIKGFPYLLT